MKEWSIIQEINMCCSMECFEVLAKCAKIRLSNNKKKGPILYLETRINLNEKTWRSKKLRSSAWYLKLIITISSHHQMIIIFWQLKSNYHYTNVDINYHHPSSIYWLPLSYYQNSTKIIHPPSFVLLCDYHHQFNII